MRTDVGGIVCALEVKMGWGWGRAHAAGEGSQGAQYREVYGSTGRQFMHLFWFV